jgi:hypothetical protein
MYADLKHTTPMYHLMTGMLGVDVKTDLEIWLADSWALLGI